jgi:hypothetical protein
VILEILNPSDAVTIEADDIVAAGIAVMIVGDGWYGLENEEGEQVVPITALGGSESWLKDNGIPDIKSYIKENRLKMAEILESVLYGHARDRALFNAAVEKMSNEDARLYREQWDDKKRSSLNHIGAACLHYAKALREMAGDKVELEPSQDKPLIFKSI